MNGFFLSQWFAEVLKFMNSYIGNYAITIILFTLIVKLLIVPLDVKQKKSTLKTTALQSKILDIKKRYPTKEKQNEKIQELYRTEKVNMFSGCLPSLISLPILIALIGSVSIIANEELVRMVVIDNADISKLQPFLWVRNMWQPDSGLATVMPAAKQWEAISKSFSSISVLNTPELLAKAQAITPEVYTQMIQPITDAYTGYSNGWFILPLLCGGIQLLQAKIMPAMPSMDGSGKKGGKTMYYIMAAVGLVICVSQSAMFALYWIMSTAISIVVQFVLNKIYKTPQLASDAN